MRGSVQDILRKWSLSIDKISALLALALMAVGVWISIASTPALALRLGLEPFYFVKQHIVVIPIGIIVMLIVSFFQPRFIRRMALLGYICCFLSLIVILFVGQDIKGARRWINLLGFSLQPSEFLKPVLTVLTAWLVAEQYRDRNFPGLALSVLSMGFVIPFLVFQPDIGMTLVLTATWIGQLFVSGISVWILLLMGGIVIGSLIGVYFVFPHFAARINGFLTGGEEVYQVRRSLEAFRNGGWFGKGPGEGIVKTLVPDAHSDFVFAVIGEEFGFVLCSIIILSFVTIIVRSLIRVIESSSLFCFSTVFGISLQLGLQIFINIATSLNLIPTKGMTLPFISYGGSSFLSTSISLGVLFAITKTSTLQKEMI